MKILFIPVGFEGVCNEFSIKRNIRKCIGIFDVADKPFFPKDNQNSKSHLNGKEVKDRYQNNLAIVKFK